MLHINKMLFLLKGKWLRNGCQYVLLLTSFAFQDFFPISIENTETFVILGAF